MVDLVGQYKKIKKEIDQSIQSVLDSAMFIKGPIVKEFELSLAQYLGVKHVISCANGTDALQISLMALNLQEGDEVILPAFTYAATAEVVALLKLKPVLVDVDSEKFNIDIDCLRKVVSSKTKVIIPVHLFGQCSDMEAILSIANEHEIKVIEDNAQAIGAWYTFENGERSNAGTIGNIGTTSFFPTKNLGCYGDRAAIFTNDDDLATKIRMICNHGQEKKYHHSIIGVNSRLDSIQAAVLNIKLKQLDTYISQRLSVAQKYDEAFKDLKGITIPVRSSKSSHTFHQYTLNISNGKRDALQLYLSEKEIPSVVYYPIPLHKQLAYKELVSNPRDLKQTEKLCNEVLSLPIHTEMNDASQDYIIESVKAFFN